MAGEKKTDQLDPQPEPRLASFLRAKKAAIAGRLANERSKSDRNYGCVVMT
jgi:hypothetical protein